jgi:hypothetical protein
VPSRARDDRLVRDHAQVVRHVQILADGESSLGAASAAA